jgi:hypothetical protein
MIFFKKRRDKANGFSILHGNPLKRVFFQLDLPATTQRIIILADNNLNYPST